MGSTNLEELERKGQRSNKGSAPLMKRLRRRKKEAQSNADEE